MCSPLAPTARPVARATTPTSVRGSSPGGSLQRRGRSPLSGRVDVKRRIGVARGFTLIELMIVLTLVAIAAGVISLSLRDPASTRLEHEAARLVALLESARAESRASGLPVRWVPQRVGDDVDFRFVGLPDDFRFF